MDRTEPLYVDSDDCVITAFVCPLGSYKYTDVKSEKKETGGEVTRPSKKRKKKRDNVCVISSDDDIEDVIAALSCSSLESIPEKKFKVAKPSRDTKSFPKDLFNSTGRKVDRKTAGPHYGTDVIDNVSALKMLLGPDCKQRALKALPVGVVTNQVLIVDMLQIKDDWQDDHRWNATSGAREKKYKVSFDEDGQVIADPSDRSRDVYRVQRHRFVHDSAPDFHRLVITFRNPDGETYPLALVQYRFDAEPHTVVNKPHGNSKGGLPFIPTKKSTLEKLTAAVKEHSSIKRAVHTVEEGSGGFMAASQSSLPRNERQGKYIRSKINPKPADPISEVITMQYNEEKKFIQGVSVEDNCPTIILFTNEQMSDIANFCTNDNNINSPLCVDMTFDIGNFYVVVTTYRHLQLRSRETGKEPVLIGPVMICTRKNRETYQSLFQKMTNACPELRSTLKAYGSDGESALIKALELEFPFAVGFLCRTHIVRNIEHKIKSDLHLSDSFYRTVVKDVFGDKQQQGLVDCTSRAEFDLNLSKLKVKWNHLEVGERRKKKLPEDAKFFLYFENNKAEILYHHCRPSLLQEVGIEEMMFDNNCPEAMNASLKTWMENKRKDVSQVVSDIRGFVMKQRHDIGKAFTEMSGPYVLKDEYDAAKMPPNFWALSPSRRRQLLDGVADVPMNPLDNEEVSTDSVTRELHRLTEKFPTEQVDALKVKVERILNGNIRQGFHGHKSRIVPSESGSQPHVIKCLDEHKYVCSTPCLQYKTHNLCSHSLAAAADNHDLNCFVTLYLSKNNTSNLTAASMANVSRHAGKKPGRTTRKRNKTKESVILTQRATLGELLRDIPPDCSQLQYSAQSCDGNELKVKFTRVSTPRPEKPVVRPTERTPVELIEISGNIRKCAGCRGDLKGGPQSQVAVDVSVQNFDSQYCLRHKEEDYFFVSKTNQWIKKFENKHYHVNRQCIVGRNPNFQPNSVHLSLPYTLTDQLRNFLVLRLQ